MSDLQTPWHRIVLLRRKLGKYIHLTEEKDNLKNRFWFGKWMGKARKKR
ncbi:MAG: hypothetical protein UU65_C0002G0277 [candidate division CPR2 bacterium GW2011_GWC1_41_48]|uniref:Uncharacterized protein n=1 Tax=candidate division CPR2 bacterium GW2011_GWC1_41_48 TaxID=1618344 RepID=A0A0G0W921_UNCC2|nr:MAG: hypothetical protein UT47_C0002G0027 [candidate division CPR2 bacterium GW2011_GWC2_39_35]KKR27227.1 MAG: hypothetical protein UT59_C0065G0001 [candidate division CPR2 bacterium GW2011_GWD1_39_7]KKR29002.1 MAG: hypothetical protein UT60_C0008G0045 [candidate division CPR2 bacterium GW2011_GWD2_39_7]KKS09499.1 MAG: hypothetical protein UU65_C0002G0277 [candidate division CPR2 bacterium GW2011_GWC1_41_48]